MNRLSLRTRLTIAFTFATGLALLASFAVTYLFVERDELRELDRALLVQAGRVAASAAVDDPEGSHLGDDPGEIVDPPSLTERYAAIYERDGRLVTATQSFGGDPPELDRMGAMLEGASIDLDHEGASLRGVVVPVGSKRVLLYALSSKGVDNDLSFLVRIFALLLAAATTLTWFVARWLAGGLVRDVDAICEVAANVAVGDFEARVGTRARGSTETRLLAVRLDQMIARLGELVASQRAFISSAAHELRSPLTSLRGELELALRRERSGDEYRETIERALADTVSLIALADDLLAIARSEGRARPARRTFVEVREIVDEAIRMARGNAESRSTTISVDGVDEQVEIGSSAKEVARALRNLIDNAIVHSPEGGDVTVRAGIEEDTVTIAVEDRGSGIRPADVPLLFTPFWRGDGARAIENGAGLGLSLAREIARAEQGDVTFDASFGPGARFVLTLPRAHAGSRGHEPRRSSAGASGSMSAA